jgi:5-methylcytosine-specific restriction endonuclease McrA
MSNLRGFWNPKNEESRPKEWKSEQRKQKRARRKKRKLEKLLLRAGAKPKGAAHRDYDGNDKFYRTEAWRSLRYLALKNSDGRCGCCGASAGDGVVLHVDHIKPRYQAPWLSLEITNLQVLCEDCNLGKGAWDSTDWRDHMRSIRVE